MNFYCVEFKGMVSIMRQIQLTLAILKPDVSAHPHIAYHIKKMMLNAGFLFVRSKRIHLTQSRVKEFYKEHEEKFFYNRLVSFMSSGPLTVHILARDQAITEWRKLMGPTKVFKTVYEDPDSIRGRFGLTDTRNSTHGSDSEETARKEIIFFFPEFNIEQWYKQEARYFEDGEVYFDKNLDVHVRKIGRDNHSYIARETEL